MVNNCGGNIDAYLEDMRYAWSKSTLRSEKYRLNNLSMVLDGFPTPLWDHIQDKKPYTRLTIWVRVIKFFDWLIDKDLVKGPNEYKKFKTQNARLFRNVYSRIPAKYAYGDAHSRVLRIDDKHCKDAALWLLKAGLRVSELYNVKDGYVYGKGGRGRQVYYGELQPLTKKVSYHKLRRGLQCVGLKPHDLRKICLTRLVEKGANEFELCAVAGWSNLNTASSYIRVNEDKIKGMMKDD